MRNSGIFLILLLVSSLTNFTAAQENSPFSRYGMGDLVPYNHVSNRSMGGIAAGYADYQVINFTNPAAFANISSTIFDLAGEVDIRNLKSNLSPEKFKSTNVLVTYLQLGIPLTSKKMQRKGNGWGFTFGLHPVTRINYKISSATRLSGIDSLNTFYQGTGGMNQFTFGTGIKLKNLRAGFSLAYNFGSKDYSTRLNLINDTVIYYKSNTETATQFTGLGFTGGLMYDINLPGKKTIRIGAYGTYNKDLNAKRTDLEETYVDDGNGGIIPIDTVSLTSATKGAITLPLCYGVGFTWNSSNWTVGADLEFAKWSQYRYYGQTDDVRDIWRLRVGAQYYPAKENTPADKYFQFVKYRIGFYYGPDYIDLGKTRPEYAITAGAGFPLTSFQLLRRGEFVVLNTGVEIGGRGNKDVGSLREGIVRFTVGLSMNAKWFQRAKYD